MNRLTRSAIGVAASISSIGAMGAGDFSTAHASGYGTANVLADMPDSDRDQAVLNGSITCSIGSEVLGMYGLTTPNATIVTDLQSQLKNEGYRRGGVDGKLGKYTCMEILEFQDDSNLYVDGIVGRQTARELDLKATIKPQDTKNPNPDVTYDIDDCKNYDVWSADTIKAVQKSLRVRPDGDFGDKSCTAMILFQDEHNIAQYGRGYLGKRTLAALGVANPVKKSGEGSISSTEFDAKTACPRATSCEIYEDLTAQMGYVKQNDGNPKTASGKTLFAYRIQSGKPGSESDTGLFTLGPVEYGPNGNPWKLSTMGSSDGEPNLYKFRRLMPVSGVWGLEGIHGSKSFGFGAGSSGCSRVSNKTADVLANLRSNTSVLVQGVKPVYAQK